MQNLQIKKNKKYFKLFLKKGWHSPFFVVKYQGLRTMGWNQKLQNKFFLFTCSENFGGQVQV